MATIKSYTSLEQSKKLAEILPIKSADMRFCFSHTLDGRITGHYPMIGSEPSLGTIPCWSLAALLSVLPQSITKYIEGESCQRTFHLNLFRSYYHCVSYSFTPSVNDDNTLYCIGRDNWVDACVDMIIRLNELKML